MVTKDISPDITTGLYPGWKKLGETSMVFGKKISTDVVNFLFYLPGKAVRRGYPRGEEGNVKGGDGVIALRPAKKRTDHRPEKEEEKKLSGKPWLHDLSRKNATPKTTHRERVPRVPSRTIFARNSFFNRIKGDTI